jgi:hypothetical protein
MRDPPPLDWEAAGRFLAFVAHLFCSSLRSGHELQAARLWRSVLNVPFQSSIRALMLLHAAQTARSSFRGE